MNIGYMRVSKSDGSQSTDLQRDALIRAGVDEKQIYEDHVSTRVEARPGLDNCLRACRSGDVLIVWRLDRLGRSLKHLVELVSRMEEQGVGLKTLTGIAIDTTCPAGRLVFAIFAALAEFERDLIQERTKAGLAAARARGRMGGAPNKMSPAKVRLAQAAMGHPETHVGNFCRELGVTRQTLYRYVSPNGTLRPDGARLLKRIMA